MTIATKTATGAAVAALILTAAACATNPVTGENELALISEPQEIDLGRSAAAGVARSIGLVDDPQLQQYVSGIGQRLAANSERPELPWQFSVVDDPTPNAFALPGGYIFVTRGLLSLMGSEAELATVLGHEIGHVTARHSVQQLSRAQLAQLGLGLGMVLVPELRNFNGLATTGLSLLFLKYGRDAERQADDLGFRYAFEQNYDVTEMGDVFSTLQRSSALEGRSAVPGWLATHPSEGERIAAVRERVAALEASQQDPRSGREEYLQQIDGLTFGQDPRQGFFRGDTFYHPELRFRFTAPQGWTSQNTAAAVVAVSPQRNGAVQLTLAPAQSATQALQAFAARSGVQVGQPAQHRIHGIPATIAPFEAQTQQGVLRGYAALLDYDGHLYQLLAYAPREAFAAYDDTFEATIASFAPVEDRRILTAQPQRIDIVRIDRPMSLEEFADRGSSPIGLDELAVINQVDDPRRRLPAGTYLKRVEQG